MTPMQKDNPKVSVPSRAIVPLVPLLRRVAQLAHAQRRLLALLALVWH